MKKFLTGLSAVYPGYLLLLALLPAISGYFIDSNLVESRNIIINLIWIPVFTVPAVFFNKRFILQVGNLLFFIAGFIEIAHWIILKGPVSLTSILVISNTNLQESAEFFDLKATYELLWLIPYFLIYILAVYNTSKHFNTNVSKPVLLIVSLITVLFIGENLVNGRLVRKGIPQLAKVGFSFIDKMKLYQEAKKITEPRNIDAKTSCNEKSQIFVLILGESCSRNHMSLYGYGRETNPLLEKRNDIKVFDDVVSPYSNTLNSVLTILSESNLINKKEVTKSINVFDVFHSAGFKTYWLSNQSPIGIWDNQVTVFANQADVTKFVNISGNSSFEAMMLSSYDAKLFKPFIISLNDSTKRKFIVLHLMGSHSSYSKRYPDKFDVFKGNGDKEELIAQYDNSILYNDFIVDSIFRILKSHAGKNKITTAIYLSDHGENVYDESDRVGHDYSGVLPKSNVEIPFIVWLSDKYQTEHPDKVKQIKSAMHKPFVSDDLFHTILDLNCIETPAFKPEHSLFNPKFFSGRKRVLEDEMDYDKKQERFRSPS